MGILDSPTSSLIVSIMTVGLHPVGDNQAPTHAVVPTQPSPGQERAEPFADFVAKAKARMEQDVREFTPTELQDIDTLFRGAHLNGLGHLPTHEGRAALVRLVTTYPRSNQAGCALLSLAQISKGEQRQTYLRQAIAEHSDAWYESGVQVGALARARLAVELVATGHAVEAERLARELVERYPDAIDHAGTRLSAVLEGLRLLRAPR
jgi:hypothetical protein